MLTRRSFATAFRHPLHLVLDFGASKPGCKGKLWLGGENASGDVRLLIDNGISVVQPASRKPAPAESLQIKLMPWVDGTGLASGDVSLDDFLKTVDELIAMMLDGEAVLSCCKNGAHRSATETTIVVMRVTGWDAQRSANYVSQLRNLVDLDSTAPVSAFRRVQTKPIEFLKRNQDRILEGSLNLEANTVVTPIQFRSKARDLGFETKGAPEDDGLRPKAKAMPAMPRTAGTQTGISSYEVISAPSGNDTLNTVSSHEMSSLSSEDTLPGSTKRVRREGCFVVVKDELATEEMRAQKLTDICDQLSRLNEKLLNNLRGSMRPPEPENPPKSNTADASAVASSASGQVQPATGLEKGEEGAAMGHVKPAGDEPEGKKTEEVIEEPGDDPMGCVLAI